MSNNKQTFEPQYQRLLDIEQTHGIDKLGLMTNQRWYDDPMSLAFLFARYKFVAKIFAGYDKVLEIGCADAFPSRIVAQMVTHLTVSDVDDIFLNDARARQCDKWAMDIIQHDILSGAYPQQYDGIYSLDVMEHIPQSQEHIYIENIIASLTPNGSVIIGMPSLESQKYASDISNAGHVNCKNGDELKHIMQKYFNNVIIFSQNDEMIHTGFFPMSHYIIAICSHQK